MKSYNDLKNRIEILEREISCKDLNEKIKLLENEVKHLKAALQYQIKQNK